MRIGNREKIVIGSILALATVGALHILVFKPRADNLAKEKALYEGKKSEIEQLGKTKSMDVINEFQIKNADYMIQFYTLVQNLNLAIPDHYTTKFDIDRQQNDLTEWMGKLLALRQADVKPKLTFLDPDHWSLPDKLPDDVTATGVDLGDRVRKVIDADEVIKVLPEGHPLRLQQEAEYKRLLKDIGVDIDQANNTLPQFGKAVTTFYLLDRAQLIRDALPKDFALKTKLRDLFRLKWPDQILVTAKQVEALVDVIGMARESGVEEIASVTLSEPMLIYPPPTEEEAKAAAAPTGFGMGGPMGPGMGGPMSPDMMMGGPMSGAPGMGPGAMMDPEMMMMMGMGGKEGMMMMGPGAGQPQAPAAEVLGSAAPFKIEFLGPNLNAMKFLYQITHSPRSYGISYLAIKSLDEPSGWIRVIATVNVVVTAGKSVVVPEEVQAKIVEWEGLKEGIQKKLGIQDQPSAPATPPSGRAEAPPQQTPAENPI